MKKAVFFDIDGTLWDDNMQVPQSTKTAIRALRRNGTYAFICSGRSRAAIQAKELLSDIGFDGILAACGTYVEYRGDVVFERTLSSEELRELTECFQRQNKPLILEGKHCLYADMEDFGGNAYILNLKESLGDGFQSFTAHAGGYDANKATAYFDGGDLEQVKRELTEKFDLIFHTSRVFEIVPKGFSKASGIAWICKYLHVAQEDTYAFGDSINDVEMLSHAGHGIAMGNATDVAKAAADYVTADLLKDGIKKGLEHFALI